MTHRHLNPVIQDTLVIMLAVTVSALMLYCMFTCKPINYPEVW